jgi:hypothetical protein
VGAARAAARQAQHGRPQRGQHQRRVLGRLRAAVEGALHGVEILRHRRHGLAVLVLAEAGDEMLVRDAEPQHEAPAGELGQRLLDRAHRHRIARVDVGNAGGQQEPLGARRQVAVECERVASDRFGNPQRRVAERLDAARERRRLVGRQEVQEGPHAEASEIHVARSSRAAHVAAHRRHVEPDARGQLGNGYCA